MSKGAREQVRPEQVGRRWGRVAAVVAPILLVATAWLPMAAANATAAEASVRQGTPSSARASVPSAVPSKKTSKAAKRAREAARRAARKAKTLPQATAPTPSAAAAPTTTPTTSPLVTIATVPSPAAPPTTAPPTTTPPTTTPPTTTPPTTTPPTTAPTASRDAKLWPFASDSPWNTPIGTGAQFASPTADPRYGDLTDAYVAINAQTWSMSTYIASPSDPIRTVTSHAGTWQYRIPDNAVPSGPTDGDRHLLVIDPTGQYVDECWLASKQGVDWWCEYHVRNNLRGAGVLEAGVRAYGGSALGGLIRTWELQQGSIRHALAMAVPRRDMAHGPVWPANSEDGGATYGGSLPMGSLVSIPRSVNLASLGLSPGGLVVAQALRDYGAYLVDASENFTLFAEPSAEGILSGARADLDKIRAQLRVVTNNSPASPGGGGTPIAPTAPGFSG